MLPDRTVQFFAAVITGVLLSCLMANPAQGQIKGFSLAGDPTSTNGATWTYRDTVDAVVYDLAGILFAPAGTGPFPAIILSHGAYDNAKGLPKTLAKQMVTWGLVCIATNYTHATGVPLGSPGSASEYGATPPNIQRAHKCRDILVHLSSVDTSRIAAHGYSNGAFITGAIVGLYPTEFLVASHSGGGVGSDFWITQVAQVNAITAPYQIHHGDADDIIPLTSDQDFDSLLQARGVPEQLCVYPGYNSREVDSPRDDLRFRRFSIYEAGHVGARQRILGLCECAVHVDRVRVTLFATDSSQFFQHEFCGLVGGRGLPPQPSHRPTLRAEGETCQWHRKPASRVAQGIFCFPRCKVSTR